MDLSKVKGGQLIAAIGGLVLLISLLFLNWYGVGSEVETPFGNFSVGADFGAWDGQGFFGTIANLIILAAGVAAVSLALLTAGSRTVALPIAGSAVTAGLGLAAVVLILARMVLQPGPNEIVNVKFGIFVALVGALLVAFGGWQSMQEEGTSFGAAADRLQGRESRNASPVGPPGGPTAREPQSPLQSPGSSPPPPPPPPPGGVGGGSA
jgi:hypothetical protein